MPQNRNRSTGWRRGGLGLAVLAICSVARGDAISTEVRDLRLKEISQKSETERARLQHNFDEFRKLPVAEQDRLRLFARQLKEDDHNEGRLRGAMNEYYEWLLTLSPGQRDDLLRESDPNHREKRVRDLLKKQQDQADATGARAGGRAPRGLSANDLAAVLAVIEEAMQAKKLLLPEEREQLKKKEGLSRHIYLIELAFRPRGGGPGQGQPPWLSKDVFEAMLNAISSPGQQHALRTNVEQRGRMMIGLIVAGIRSEYDAALEKAKPDQAALDRFFVELSSEQQDEIMRVPFDEQQQKLMHLYLEKKSAEDPEHFPKPPQFPWMRRPQQMLRIPPAARGGESARGADGDSGQKENLRNKNKNKAKAQKAKTPGES